MRKDKKKIFVTGASGFVGRHWCKRLLVEGNIVYAMDLKETYKDTWQPKTTCDTELLAFLLDRSNSKTTISSTLDSMHAYAYYDKDDKTITLSRDHAGVKPLY